MDWTGDLRGWLAALGIGLLIGAVRERLGAGEAGSGGAGGGSAPAGQVRAGLRTHAVLALAAAAAIQLGVAVLGVLLLAVAALVVASYWASHREDPGLTGEVALLLTAVLAAYAMRAPAFAAGLGVVAAILLQAKRSLHRFARELVSAREMHDALLLAAAALVVLPLLPDHPLDPWGALRPALLWKFVVLVMAVGMAGHVALRAVGARWGLPVAGFFAGFASSTAAVAGFGGRVREQPALRTPAVAAALLANVASLLLFAAILGTGAPALLRQMALPLCAAILVLAAGGALGLHRGAALATLPDAPPPRAFHPGHALVLALLLAAVLLFSAWMRLWFGDGGALLASALVALGELHAAAASVAQMSASGALDPRHAEWGVIALLGAAALSKSVLAFASGGAAYGTRVAAGLGMSLLAAIAMQALRG
jgi:uncharacterized membrane protein (DUF4010 family)